MQKSFNIDFWLGSKYGSWQYCQKKIFLQLCRSFCVIIFIMHILVCHKNQKNVLQKEIKDWYFEVYLFNWGNQSVLDSCWVNHWKGLVPDSMLFYMSNREGLDCFLQPNILSKLSKITVTCPNPVKMNK